MKIIKTELEGLFVIQPRVFEDYRGWFCETYSGIKLEEEGIEYNFIQDNHSLSVEKGTLRGLHFQNAPHAQTKLVRCTRGSILDVAVDLRENSKTYLKHFKIVLSEQNKQQLLVPQGFAHGFLTLEDNTEIQYKVDNYYNQESDSGIIYNDKTLGVDWGNGPFIMSEKDMKLKNYEEIK